MKTQIILLATLSLLAGSSLASASAFDETSVSAFDKVRPLVPTEVARLQAPELNTRDLQKQVLIKVNSALTHGTISVAEATDLKGQLDSLGESESWYQTLDKPVPQEVFEQHKQTLNAMSQKLDKTPLVAPAVSSRDALHTDIGQLISRALASNKISSDQAEAYFSRLAQIESSLQAPRDASDRSASEVAALTKDLQDLKASLNH